MNVLCVVGTRPEAIKMAPVVRALQADHEHFHVTLCVTAQHRDLLDGLLTALGLQADDDLDLMRADQSLPDLTAALFRGLGPVMAQRRPDWVVVQGDTTSALVAAITAFYAGARVAHVEAGLRTGRVDEPFPEEMNRVLIARVADLHCAPTGHARAHLLAEGIDAGRIVVTGNTSIDSLYWMLDRHARSPDAAAPDAARVIFVTVHRRESFGEPLEAICDALKTLAGQIPADVTIVFAVHPNPRVSGPVRRLLAGLPNVQLVDPLSYPETVAMLARCHFVITDSGGLQEEAPALGKPVLVLREATERPEGIEAGVAILVGRDPKTIVAQAMRLLDDGDTYVRMARVVSPYGDGRAADRVVQALRTRALALGNRAASRDLP